MFYCDGVELSHDSDAAVLSIGLGGGVMNITVLEISAQIANVASKWFNLKLDDHHSLIITDGVEFVKEQAERGWKYGVYGTAPCYSAYAAKVELTS
ncbi:hypothetical protein ANCDUO_09681 [Ancylostoma duodenale]|uniref:Uncharacterized protein n=1 Tax=Ancylostoma duodenale TaxID=51022 RepID=A0A0C2GM77_9BILA|nr:hypothetical protein ANCDUO_09681 [Ancylostoma duodenale]